MAGKDRKRATGAVAVPFGFMASGCLLQQQPTPTTIPEPAHRVWVEWENRTEDVYALTIDFRRGEVAYGLIEPCMAHGMGVGVDGPFSIGVAPWSNDITQPGPEVANERDWEAAAEEFLLVITEESGVTPSTRRPRSG